MKKIKILLIILILSIIQNCTFASFWTKSENSDLGNTIEKEDLLKVFLLYTYLYVKHCLLYSLLHHLL